MDPASVPFGCGQIANASAESPLPFIRDSAEPGSVVHTDGWLGYEPLERKGYDHDVTFLEGRKQTPSELLPRVHRVTSLLKRWLLGTHQGPVSLEHLDYYLDEFTFRFDRRKSRSRGKLFYSRRPSAFHALSCFLRSAPGSAGIRLIW